MDNKLYLKILGIYDGSVDYPGFLNNNDNWS